ncbi:glucose-6-phosphate exchanger SLC37A4 [Trichonephila clavipes]|nr:glucose-6-phosphate exchanger SLC37A4 [Trichonephila clavipes]
MKIYGILKCPVAFRTLRLVLPHEADDGRASPLPTRLVVQNTEGGFGQQPLVFHYVGVCAVSSTSKRFSTSSCRLAVALFFMISNVIIIQTIQSTITESSSLAVIMSLGFVLGTTLYGPITVFGIVASESAPAHLSGSAHAVASLAGNVGAMISGFPFCYIAKQYNWSVVFFILKVATSAVVILILCCRNLQPKLTRRQKED